MHRVWLQVYKRISCEQWEALPGNAEGGSPAVPIIVILAILAGATRSAAISDLISDDLRLVISDCPDPAPLGCLIWQVVTATCTSHASATAA